MSDLYEHDQWVTKLIFVFTPSWFFFSAGFQRADNSPHSHHSPDQFLMAGQLHSGGDADHVGARCFRLSDGGTTRRQFWTKWAVNNTKCLHIHTDMYTLHIFIIMLSMSMMTIMMLSPEHCQHRAGLPSTGDFSKRSNSLTSLSFQSAKMFNYAGWRKTCNFIFILFAAVFIVTRLVILPFW